MFVQNTIPNKASGTWRGFIKRALSFANSKFLEVEITEHWAKFRTNSRLKNAFEIFTKIDMALYCAVFSLLIFQRHEKLY